MAILMAIGLGILALVFVLYPLAQRTSKSSSVTLDAASSETAQDEREQAARTALQEVELDFQLGNIAEPEYRTLRERYMRRALVALKSRYDREQELDEMIEQQLFKMKEQGKGSDEDATK